MLFAIDEIVGDTAQVGYSVPLTVAFLKANPFLLVDTAFFNKRFKTELLNTVDSLDAQIDGVIFCADNYHALNLINDKYAASIKCAYIDPPYNTGEDGFAYRDSYKTSSWLSMMSDRLSWMVNLMQKDGVFFGSIDERELHSFDQVLKNFKFNTKII